MMIKFLTSLFLFFTEQTRTMTTMTASGSFFPLPLRVSTLTSLSRKAVEVLETNKEEITDTTMFREVLSHDGYDEEGFKSELWDLYWIDIGNRVGREEERIFKIKHFHREHWYWGKDQQKYDLVEERTLDRREMERRYPEWSLEIANALGKN
jgi:hypothetical protein